MVTIILHEKLHSCSKKQTWNVGSKFMFKINVGEFAFKWFECYIENDGDW